MTERPPPTRAETWLECRGYKIGMPTLSSTGSETSRICVLTNYETGVKLGMNSDYSVFDQLILDIHLTATVPRDQYFYTNLYTYFHRMETLNKRTRNGIGDVYSEKTIDLCRQIFLQDDMQDEPSREHIMIASLMGGAAGGNTGLVHPLSAGLSVVLGIHRSLANCLAMGPLAEYHPAEHAEFTAMVQAQDIALPNRLEADLGEEQIQRRLLHRAREAFEQPLGRRFQSHPHAAEDNPTFQGHGAMRPEPAYYRIPFSGYAHRYTSEEMKLVARVMQEADPLTQGRHLKEFDRRAPLFRHHERHLRSLIGRPALRSQARRRGDHAGAHLHL
ncbi:hypothetical protein DFAR_2810010 [Desulfarculales bacterium]